ncbi:unnamed protein product [Polarella glacialis]|uniref:Uncharacterized protein n=1 Tax=Polarella glacialis TaxID=89957 RepID=A0A813DEV8_POLGL|nr:unnamed protein product [Polarella glacialis]
MARTAWSRPVDSQHAPAAAASHLVTGKGRPSLTKIQVWQSRLVIVGFGDFVNFGVPEPRPTMCVCLSALVCLLALVIRRQALVSDRSCRQCVSLSGPISPSAS